MPIYEPEFVEGKVGTIGGQGRMLYPTQTLSGREGYEFPPTQLKNIGGNQFVVLDIFPPKGFDVEAEVAKLKPQSVIAATKAKKADSAE